MRRVCGYAVLLLVVTILVMIEIRKLKILTRELEVCTKKMNSKRYKNAMKPMETCVNAEKCLVDKYKMQEVRNFASQLLS